MPVGWSHRICGSSIIARWAPPAFKDGYDFDTVDGAVEPPYSFPSMRVEYVRHEPPGIPTAFWRSVGPSHNVFVVEGFIDELAAAAKKDPVDYRRALLGKSPRALGGAQSRRREGRLGTGIAQRVRPRHFGTKRVRKFHGAGRRGRRRQGWRRQGQAHHLRGGLRHRHQPQHPRGASAKRHRLRPQCRALWADHPEGRPGRAEQFPRLSGAAHQ